MSHEQSVVYYTGVRMTELSRDKKKQKKKKLPVREKQIYKYKCQTEKQQSGLKIRLKKIKNIYIPPQDLNLLIWKGKPKKEL